MGSKRPWTTSEGQLWADIEELADKSEILAYKNSREPISGEHAKLSQEAEKAQQARFASPPEYETTMENPEATKLTSPPPGRENASIFDKKFPTINMFSPNDEIWYGLFATLDTGTDENWISTEVVTRLGLEVTRGLPMEYLTIGGPWKSSGQTVCATWGYPNTGVSHHTQFCVVSNPPFDVLLGRNLLASGKTCFSSNKKPSAQTLLSAQLSGSNKTPEQKNEDEELIAKRTDEEDRAQRDTGRLPVTPNIGAQSSSSNQAKTPKKNKISLMKQVGASIKHKFCKKKSN